MSKNLDDPNLILSDDDVKGWFKFIIPNIADIFGALWGNTVPGSQVELLPFIYCKLDQQQVAFDLELSQPMYAIDKVCLVQIDRAPKPGSKVIPVVILGLRAISAEHECRCYLPTFAVSCIIPIRPDHELINSFEIATNEGQVIAPTTQEASSILNLPGNPISE